MPSFASALESTLHKALEAASSRRHEYATLEHLLLALVDDEHASKVMSACGVEIDELLVVGEEVPASVVIEAFPEDVYREVPTVREYRYVCSGSDVYLVDPGSRRVIEELE